MVNLSDIPFVGVIIKKISEATVEFAILGLRYLLCSQSLYRKLSSEITQVTIREEDVRRKVDAARIDGKLIKDHVKVWQKEMEDIKIPLDELSRINTSCTCFEFLHCTNPWAHFRLGRNAANLAKSVADLIVSGDELLAGEIAYLPAIEYVPSSDTTYQSFPSRQKAYEKLWSALANQDGYPVIGIYGMAGAGKTRMMEKACKNAMDQKIFDKVVRVNVGNERFTVMDLQNKLAVSLGCHLESDNESQRVLQLQNSLKAGGKTLVVFDDVWEVIPLIHTRNLFGDDGSKGCKILLTTRLNKVCKGSNCTDPIEIGKLTDTEAWEMFSNTVGIKTLLSLKDPLLAPNICKECGALPLLIDAVGNTLKDQNEGSWKDALDQLENSKFHEIDGIDPQVYTCIGFSFNRLPKGEKACLLLSSFFPEDADIEIDMLFDMATGSELLGSGRNIEGVVTTLKSSSLLLEGGHDSTIKVHDVIRDVARSIAARDPDFAFLHLRCKSTLPDREDYPTTRLLHFDLDGEHVDFPDDLVCPKLHTLWMDSNNKSQQLSSGFSNAFLNLKVLFLGGMVLSEHILSLDNFKKLRVLILMDCGIAQTFLSSVPKKIETLCIRNCDLPSPLDLPEMKNLKKLELVVFREVEMVANAISRLSNLEELNIPGGFRIEDETDNTSVSWELSQLGCLRKLNIILYDSHHYQDKDFFSSLIEFNIRVGFREKLFDWPAKNKCEILFFKGFVESGLMALLERAEIVEVVKVKGLPNGFSHRNTRVAFKNLEALQISGCEDMEHVACWDEKNLGPVCFTNLSILNISSCDSLEYVFSVGVAKCLRVLKYFRLSSCWELEEIIRVDDRGAGEEEIVSFPMLETLVLWQLPSLTSFCRQKVAFPNLVSLEMKNVNPGGWTEEIVLGSNDQYSSSKITTLKVELRPSKMEPDYPPLLLPAQWKLHLQNLEILVLSKSWWPGHSLFDGTLTLKRLRVLSLDRVQVSTLFTNAVFRSFHQLQELNVSGGSVVKEIVEEDAIGDGATIEKTPISLRKLKSVSLSDLPNLLNIGISACYMPALVTVDIHRCGPITSALFTRSAFKNLQQLQHLDVSTCPLLEEIVDDEMDDATPGTSDKIISLPS